MAIPPGFDTSDDLKAEGIIELPVHVWWSEPTRTFDMRDLKVRIRVYELVLSEGDEDDVRFYVRFDELRTSWPHLFIPRHVREAWEKQYPQLVGVR